MNKKPTYWRWLLLVVAGLFFLNTASYAQVRQIETELTTTSMYTAGATSTFNFTLNVSSPDWEWIEEFGITFPTGVTLNTGTALAGASATIIGQTIYWEPYFGPGNGNGNWLTVSRTFSVNATIAASMSGNMTLNWEAYGDGSGAGPHSDAGTTIIMEATMGIFNGFVYNHLNNAPIAGATVAITGPAGNYTVQTSANGSYSTQANSGTYNITASAAGFTSQTLTGIPMAPGGAVGRDFYLMEVPFPVADVTATALDNNRVQVSWDGSGPPPPPLVQQWLGYDNNGVPTQYWWAGAGTPFSWAINFEPADLAGLAGTSLTKIAIFGTDASDVNTLNIYQGNLAAGTATLIHTQALTGLALEAWNEVALIVPVPIDITKQLWVAVHSTAPTGGVAASTPILNLKGDWVNFTGTWNHMSSGLGYNVTWSLRAFATNASGKGATQLVHKYSEPRYSDVASNTLSSTPIVGAKAFRPANNDTRAVVGYDIWREKIYQPGSLVKIGSTTNQKNYIDFGWADMDWGIYRWAVTVKYDESQVSVPTFSNALEKNMNVKVNVAVNLNSGESAGGTSVTFTNTSEPALDLAYTTELGGTGAFTWNAFRRGIYDVEVILPGYTVVNLTGVEIYADATFTWLLEEILTSPAALYVTPTGFATWNLDGGGSGGVAPFEPFFENFDAVPAASLPEGWSKTPVTNNWNAHAGSQAGGTANQMRFYWSPSGINDYYLKTPVMSTAGQTSLQLSFKHLIDDYSAGDPYNLRVVAIANGVEYIIHEWINPSSIPSTAVVYDLTAAHGVGAAEFQIAWVFSGNTFDINNWYLDDVLLNGSRAKAGRSFETTKVFLDGVLITQTTENEYQYGTNGEALVANQTYTAGVAAVYTTGQSPTAEFDFIYVPCGSYATPTALVAAQVEGTLNIKLDWTNVNAAALDTISALRIFRNGVQYAELDFTSGTVNTFLDANLEFGLYKYCLTYVYDSGAETCPGVVCSGEIEIDGNAYVKGMVTQAAYLGGGPVAGATVKLVNVTAPATTFEFTTNATGAYTGEILAGTYNYTVSAAGYTTVDLANVAIVLNATVTRDFVLIEFPAPPVAVKAVEIADNNVQVSWNSPTFAPFVPIFETFNDGIPSTWTIETGGTTAATWYMETPANNPQTAGSSLDGSNFAYVDSDEAGTGVTIDAKLYTPVINASIVEGLYLSFDQYYRHLGNSNSKVDVYNGTEWVNVLSQTATAGAWGTPNHKVIDVTMHANENFQVRFHYTDGGSWSWFWAVDNVAITNEVTRSGAPVLTSFVAPERSLYGYEVWRTTCETGTLQLLGLTFDTIYNDNTWGAVETGMYKWGVRAVYDQENYSEVIYSNCLDKNMITAVSVKVTTNSGDSPEGTKVSFTNTSEPELELVYMVTLDGTGIFAWDDFRKGVYDIHVEKNGFAVVDILNENIDGPKNYIWMLEELLNPVADLHVSPTGFATWRDGGIVPFEPVSFDFEADAQGWEIQNNVNGWQWGNNASLTTSFMNFNGNTTNFIAVNADAAGSGGAPIVAMAKSPVMNLENADQVFLSFDYKLKTDKVTVHYSINGGDPVQFANLAVSPDSWKNQVIEVPEEALIENVQIIFLYTEASTWSYGAGIDNVVLTDIAPDIRALEEYKVWLDGVFVANTPNTFYQYDPATLTPGQEYFSEVAAVYSNGLSAKMNYTWTYYPCDSFPGPQNLTYEIINETNVKLSWTGGDTPPPPPTGDGIDENFEGGSMPVGWTVIKNNTAAATGPVPSFWTVTDYSSTTFVPFGSYHAGMWWDYAHQDEWLITPEFTCDAGAVMNFATAVYEGSTNGDHYYVKVSTDGGSTWTSIWDASTLSGNAWNYYATPYNINLNAYAGQDIKIAFNAVDGDGQGLWYVWFVDNVKIGSPTRTIAFSPESMIRKSNSTGNTDQIARDGNIARIERKSASTFVNVAETAEAGGKVINVAGESKSLSSNRALLYNNGPLVNSPGTGPGGTDQSILQNNTLGMTTLGAGCQFASGNHMADDFVVDANWTIDDFTFYTYQTGSTTTSTITGGYLQIYNGNPSTGGTVVWGDMVTNRMSSTSFSNIYRLSEGTPGTTRPVMSVVCSTPGLTLTPGTYWVEFTLDGSLASGPWAPPITITGQATTGNGLQNIAGVWGPFEDGGSFTMQGLPFLINGTAGSGGGGSTTFDPGELLGANVYRDGELIAEMVQGLNYTDTGVEPGTYDYCVTFIYEGNAMSCAGASCVEVSITENCIAPENLTAELSADKSKIILEWNTDNFEGAYLSYGSLAYSNSIGVGGDPLTAAIQLDPAMLAPYDGRVFSKIKMYYGTGPIGNVTIQIWEGTTLVREQAITGTVIGEAWNEFTFNQPLVIDGTKSYKVGYTVANYSADGFPGGAQDYMGNPNSDVIFYQGAWDHLNNYLPYSWLIEAYVSSAGKDLYDDVVLTSNVMSNSTNSTLVTSPKVDLSRGDIGRSTRAFMGYNVYRGGTLLNSQLLPTNYYEDTPPGVANYCYTVTAVYSICGESDPSNQVCIDFHVGVENNDLSNVKVYPNPSNSIVNIDLTDNVSQVVIYNFLGQVVYENNVTDETRLKINVSNYESGAYLVKFITNEGRTMTKKVVVTK